MKPPDLQRNLELLFGKASSPGQAFDALLAMRHDGVTLDNVRLFLSDSVTQTELAMAMPAGQIANPGEMNELSLMPFGKYKGTMLRDLPGDYLAWLFRQGDDLSSKPLAKFIATYKRAQAACLVNKDSRMGSGYVDEPPPEEDDVPF